tara:strand:- start:27 stop:494 length:468 start_codon:yes stop_codon:yes gene_type:complete
MKKQKKYTKRRLSKWVLLTLPTSALKKMDSETLNKYAKMYGVKSPKGKPSYTDKELVRELSKFIYAEKKRRADYWECEKKGKKKIGKYPIKRNYYKSKAYKTMSSSKIVSYYKRRNKLTKKNKKQIDSYNKKLGELYDKCNKQQKKLMDKQIQKK